MSFLFLSLFFVRLTSFINDYIILIHTKLKFLKLIFSTYIYIMHIYTIYIVHFYENAAKLKSQNVRISKT